jgi:beta-1,4-mannosyltransferase
MIGGQSAGTIPGLKSLDPDPPAPVTVLSTPLVRGNPYQQLLGRALAESGARSVTESRPRLRRVLSPSGRRALIHLHWPEIIIGSNRHGPFADLRSLLKAARLLAILGLARRRGIRIVWTIHNLVPHEARRPSLDLKVNRCIAGLADSVLTHSRHAASRAEAVYPATRIDVAYHGNYVGFYPEPRRSGAAVRADIGIPEEARVFLAFGFVRPYKRLPELIAAFRQMDRDDARLVVAGLPFTPALRAELEELAARDRRVVLLLRRIDDREVRELHAAADVCVLAYRDVFSSGALMLALSCGVPVVAPDDSTATELAPRPAVIPFFEGELGKALEEAADLDDEVAATAMAVALRYSWSEMASAVLQSSRGR